MRAFKALFAPRQTMCYGMFDRRVMAWDEVRRDFARLGIRRYSQFEAHMLISSEHSRFAIQHVTNWLLVAVLAAHTIRFEPS